MLDQENLKVLNELHEILFEMSKKLREIDNKLTSPLYALTRIINSQSIKEEAGVEEIGKKEIVEEDDSKYFDFKNC
jgi:hypothetical protein